MGTTDTTHDAKSVTEKRAQFENIEVVRADESHYNAANLSHGTENQSDHTYTVDVNPETGSANACRCPDYQYRRSKTGDSCKHMLAVENHIETTPTIAAAPSTVAADGGTIAADGEPVETDETDIHDVADELSRKCLRGNVTVMGKEEISIRSEHVMLDRLFSTARSHGFRMTEVYPQVGGSDETDLVLKRAE